MISELHKNEVKLTAKEKILLTAHRLFYSHGIKITGIDRIIAEANVTKVTFYRHFPSKNTLIIAYLDYRHRIWMDWFRKTLSAQCGIAPDFPVALANTLKEWFSHPDFRGCAFINATAEAGELITEIQEISVNHKQDMAEVICYESGYDHSVIDPLVLIIDGAVVHAQMGNNLHQIALMMKHTFAALLLDKN